MVSAVKPFDTFNTPRIAQLSQRSNQFNLRTIRYTEADVTRMTQSDEYATFSFTLEDKFGEHGLICVVILQKETNETLFIDTWFMSCRVLKRGMENFVLNTLVDYAKAHNFVILKGEYIATPKNALVKDHYPDLGFSKQDAYYVLKTDTYVDKEAFITLKK
jgi:FkbH-like protein